MSEKKRWDSAWIKYTCNRSSEINWLIDQNNRSLVIRFRKISSSQFPYFFLHLYANQRNITESFWLRDTFINNNHLVNEKNTLLKIWQKFIIKGSSMDHNNYCIASPLQCKPYYFHLSTIHISSIYCNNRLNSLNNQLSCRLRFSINVWL